MAEVVLCVAGSIAGLAALAGKVASHVKTVYDGWNDAAIDCTYVVHGTRDFARIMALPDNYFKLKAQSIPALAQAEEAEFRDVLRDCETILESLRRFMEGYDDVTSSAARRTKWANLGQFDCKKFMDRLESHKNTISVTLQLTQCATLNKLYY